MALSLFAKLLMMERDSWKRELPVSATSEISWLTAMIIWREKGKWQIQLCRGGGLERRRQKEGMLVKSWRAFGCYFNSEAINSVAAEALRGACVFM